MSSYPGLIHIRRLTSKHTDDNNEESDKRNNDIGEDDFRNRFSPVALRFTTGQLSRCGVKSGVKSGVKRRTPRLRILGGRPAEEADHPWQVHIRIQAKVGDATRKKTFGGR